MRPRSVWAALAAFLFAGIGASAMATPSFHSSLKKAVKSLQDEADAPPANYPYPWTSPNFIQSGLVTPGVSFTFGDSYAAYQGRSFELKQEQLQVGIDDNFELFYGRQFALAKGRAATTRFHDDDEYFGFRWVFKEPSEKSPSTASVQYEGFRPQTAVATTSSTGHSSEADYNAPSTNILSVSYGDRALNQYQLSYSVVQAPLIYDSHAVNLGFAHDFKIMSNTIARLQAVAVMQSFTGATSSSNFELKSIITGAVSYSPTRWLSVEGAVTMMPNGLPFESGDFTGVSSFALYQPTGIVDDLRSDFLVLGSLKILAHWKF